MSGIVRDAPESKAAHNATSTDLALPLGITVLIFLYFDSIWIT